MKTAAESKGTSCWDLSKIQQKGTGHNEATGIICIIYYVQGVLREIPIELREYVV